MTKGLKYVYLLLLVALLVSCKNEGAQHSRAVDLPQVDVGVMKVEVRQDHVQTEVVGTVHSVNEAVIAAKITGTIEQLPVVLGSRVRTGDLLVKISAGEISAQAIQAQTQLEQARRNLEREKKLLQKNAATPESVKSLEEMYRVAEAAHREALTMLSYTAVTAPFDGAITAKMASIGDLATPGAPLLRLEDMRRLQVEIAVPEALVLRIEPGNTLPVHIPAAALDIDGIVAEIAPAADPQTRTTLVKIDIEPVAELRSGQFARVLIPSEMRETLYVPAAAVTTFGQMERVFVIEDNTAHLRIVRTGAVLGDRKEILAGLDPGEVVAVSDTSQILDGQPVTIVK